MPSFKDPIFDPGLDIVFWISPSPNIARPNTTPNAPMPRDCASLVAMKP